MRHPFRFRYLGAVAAVVATLAVGATTARGDLAPPDSCTAPGQPCTSAGPQFNGEGTCVTMTCTKQVPAPDGGMTSMTYDCNRCEATGGGGGGGGSGTGGGGGGSGTGGGGAGGSASKPLSKSSGCAVAAEHGNAGSLALTVSLLAGLVLVAARRRNAGE